MKITVEAQRDFLPFKHKDVDFDRVARDAVEKLMNDRDFTDAMAAELYKRGFHLKISQFGYTWL